MRNNAGSSASNSKKVTDEARKFRAIKMFFAGLVITSIAHVFDYHNDLVWAGIIVWAIGLALNQFNFEDA